MNEIIVKCDFCNKQAYVDGKTKMGPWAYMCPNCLDKYGYPGSKMNTQLVDSYPSERFNEESNGNS